MKNIIKIVLAVLGVTLIVSLVSKFAINKKSESEVKTKVIPVVSIEAEQFDDEDTFTLDEEEDKAFKENDSIYVSLPDVDSTLLFRKNSLYEVDDISYLIFNCVLKNNDINVVENYEIIYSSNGSCDLSITQTNFSDSIEPKQLYRHNIEIKQGYGGGYAYLSIDTTSNTGFTLQTLQNYFSNENITSKSSLVKATGTIRSNGVDYNVCGVYYDSSILALHFVYCSYSNGQSEVVRYIVAFNNASITDTVRAL